MTHSGTDWFKACLWASYYSSPPTMKVPRDLDMSVHGGGLSSPDQPLQLCSTVVLGLRRQLLDVHVKGQKIEASHLVGVDGQDLDTALLIGQTWN